VIAQGQLIAALHRELRAALAPRPVDEVTVTVAARLAGRSPQKIRRWCASGDIGEMDNAPPSAARSRAHREQARAHHAAA